MGQRCRSTEIYTPFDNGGFRHYSKNPVPAAQIFSLPDKATLSWNADRTGILTDL
jgi:hypothetical protein